MNTKVQSALNVIWKVAVGIIGLYFLLWMGARVYGYFDRRYARAYWSDKELSENVTARYFKNGRYKVYNKETGQYTTGKIRWISTRPYRDSLTVYCDEDHNRGYVNCNTGEIAIPASKARYQRAWHFSEGRAVVVLPHTERLSVIDAEGKVIARNVAPYIKGNEYVFVDGVCEMEENDHKGLMRIDGTWALDMKYYYLQTQNTEGYRLARNEEGWWLFDSEFNQVFDEPYDGIEYATGREHGTLFLTKGHSKMLTEYDGTVVEPFVIDGTYDLKYVAGYDTCGDEKYSIDSDLVVYRVNRWEGLMNKHTGRLITPADYTNFTMVSKELILAELSFNYEDEAVVMNRSGKVLRNQ